MLLAENVRKTYRKDGRTITAVGDVTCRAEPGEVLVLHGPSGSGKSTLLLMLGGMLAPDAGRVTYASEDLYAWPARKRNRFRNRSVGFMFQRFFLLPYLTVYDNIRVPLRLGRRLGGEAEAERVNSLARRLGLEDRLTHRPDELSVGQRQRVALARALAPDPQLLLADEPTANLDADNVEIITSCLQEQAREGRIVIVATHCQALRSIATRQVPLDGDAGSTPCQP